MKLLLEDLFQHRTIDRAQAREALIGIGEGRFNPSQIASFLTVFRMRSLTVEELSGFREAMLELCSPVDLSSFETIDVCGTGGDGKDTFNISTLTAFTLAGCGVKVAKHGNYGVSSGCGSSNVLEELGVEFTNNVDTLHRQLEQAGICFLHAPLFHPAMKYVGPTRKELGVRTFFNLLGPLVNPARPKYQLTGVFSLEIARLYNYLFQKIGIKASVCHSLDGYDEVSLTGKCRVSALGFDRVLSPSDFGLSELKPEAIAGGSSPAQGAKIFYKVISGEGTSDQMDVVCANAALGLRCIDPSISLPDRVAKAREAIASGKVKEVFCSMKEIR